MNITKNTNVSNVARLTPEIKGQTYMKILYTYRWLIRAVCAAYGRILEDNCLRVQALVESSVSNTSLALMSILAGTEHGNNQNY